MGVVERDVTKMCSVQGSPSRAGDPGQVKRGGKKSGSVITLQRGIKGKNVISSLGGVYVRVKGGLQKKVNSLGGGSVGCSSLVQKVACRRSVQKRCTSHS